MADDKTIGRQTTRSSINLNRESEVSYWCTWFGVTPDELRQAVEAVGSIPANVEARLRGRNSRGRSGRTVVVRYDWPRFSLLRSRCSYSAMSRESLLQPPL
jgi:hypothetical protein